MLNAAELRASMARAGYNQQQAAFALGINPKTFGIKMQTGKFGLEEMDKMIDLFKIDDPAFVFFNRKVSLKDTK